MLEIGLEPPGVTTMTSRVAAPVMVGDVAAMVESLSTITLEAGIPSKVTHVAPVNPLPVMVTLVPPFGEPELGETPVTTGAGVGAVPAGAELSTRVELSKLPTPVQPEDEEPERESESQE